MASIEGVLLDVDGTLVNSNDAHALAWTRAFSENGVECSIEQIRPLIGMGGDKIIPRIANVSEDSSLGKRISHRREEIFRHDCLPGIRPTSGAEDLLRHLSLAGLRLVVASSAKEEELHGLLRICHADQFIEGATSSDHADRSKPDPDIVQAAREKMRLPPDRVIMIGDTPYDLEAAQRAGVALIAFRCGGWGDRDLAGATAIYNDPRDLLNQIDSSPLAT